MRGAGRKTTEYDTVLGQPPPREALGALAGRQYGVVTLSQLRALGISAEAARSRVATGNLHRLHRGVYAVGHSALTVSGRWLAAVLACGPGAVLSHRDAAALLALRPSARRVIDVTAGRVGRARPGIEVHRSGTLLDRDTTTRSGIPCTTVARTLLDLADVLDRRGLERACEQAEVLRVFDLRQIEDVLARANGRCGAALLRAVLDEHHHDQGLTRSDLEELFLSICDQAALPRPRVNAYIALEGEEVEGDFVWPQARLIVETDGYASHGTRRGFEHDRERDRRLLLAGWRVARFTWREVQRDPAGVADTLRHLLRSFP